MYKLSFLNRDKKEKKGNLEDHYIGLDKAIYTEPIEIDTSSIASGDNPTRFSKVDDKQIHLDLSFVVWIELIIVVVIFSILTYVGVYEPIYNYNMDINVVRELAETGKSSYSKDIQEKYASESSIDYYKFNGLNKYRKVVALGDSGLIMLILSIPISIWGICWANVCAKHCLDRLVLCRDTGMIYYRYNYGLFRRKCKFDEALFQSQINSLLYVNDTFLALRFPNAKGYMMLSPTLPYISISLYVWYMDKNRPLPPGTAFDAYREEDYLRRSAAKFPDPLYPAGIPTPEDPHLVKKYNDRSAQKRAVRFYDSRLRALAAREDIIRDRG